MSIWKGCGIYDEAYGKALLLCYFISYRPLDIEPDYEVTSLFEVASVLGVDIDSEKPINKGTRMP